MMTLGDFRWLNPVLAHFGRKIAPLTIGHWFVEPNGGLACTRRQVGWYLAGPGEWEGLPENLTALQRMLVASRRGQLTMKCQDCHGTGWAVPSCCEGMVGTAADMPGETRDLTAGEQQTMRRALRAFSRLIAVGAEAPGVVLHLTDEQRDVLRQELYHTAHKLDAQARTAPPRSTRHKALTQRSALLRSVAEQLA